MIDGGVLVLYNRPRADASPSDSGRADASVAPNRSGGGPPAPRGAHGFSESDAGVLAEVEAVCAALSELGVPYRQEGVCSLADVGAALARGPEACVINLVESLGSGGEECLVPAICEALGRSWTGNGAQCQILALDKWQSKCALEAAGISVPRAVVVPCGCDGAVPDWSGLGPVIVKPLRADASEGIEAASVLTAPTRETVLQRVARIHDAFGQPALVESFVSGREFNVALLEQRGTVLVLPLAEIDFGAYGPERPRIVDYRAKWIETSFEFSHTPRLLPAPLDESVAERIRRVALDAWDCMGCRDYARVDMRLDDQGRPFVLEVNPNPDISPDAGYVAALRAAGLDLADFLRILLENRSGQSGGDAGPRSRRAGQGRAAAVRWTEPADRDAIVELLAESGVFRACELDVAREVLDDALARGSGGHYQSYTALVNGAVAGWACFGPTPCTVGAFDLYWLAVSPACRGRGVGAVLVSACEADMRARGGRLVVVETSARPDYAPARRFYLAHGYRVAAAVADFYDVGDDKLILLKKLSGPVS